MLKKISFLVITVLVVLFLGGCLSNEEKKILESVPEKKKAEEKIKTDLKEIGIDQIIFDGDSQLVYPQNGKFPDTDFVCLAYNVEFGLFTFSGTAKFSIKNTDDKLSIDELVDNGITGTESSSDLASSFAQSVCDELKQRFLEGSKFKEIMDKMNFNRTQLKEIEFFSDSSNKNIKKMLAFLLKNCSYEKLNDNDLQNLVKLIAGNSFLNQQYIFRFGVTAESLSIDEENFQTVMNQNDLTRGTYMFDFEDQSFEITKISKEEMHFIQSKENTDQAQELLKKSLLGYSIQDNLQFDNKQQLQFTEKFDKGLAYDFVQLDYSLKFSTFQYDGTAVFHLKEEGGELQLDKLKSNTLESKEIDYEETGAFDSLPFSDFFLQPLNEEIMNQFYESTRFSNLLKAIGIGKNDVTEKQFFCRDMAVNLPEELKIAKKVSSYANYSLEELIDLLERVNNNHEVNPIYQFVLSITTNDLDINKEQLVKLAKKNKFSKGTYIFNFTDKEVNFEIK